MRTGGGGEGGGGRGEGGLGEGGGGGDRCTGSATVKLASARTSALVSGLAGSQT